MTSKESTFKLPSIKVVCLGDSWVGKTSMLISYVKRQFPDGQIPNVFDSYFQNKSLDGIPYELHIIDTAGQEEYDRLRWLVYPQTNVFLLCFSLVRRDSLRRIKTKWVPEIRKHCKEPKFILVGMKNDLAPKEMRTGKTYLITREKYSIMYEKVIKYLIRNCSDKGRNFDVSKITYKNYPNDLVKIMLKYCQNLRAKSEQSFQSYSKLKNVSQIEIDQIIEDTKPNNYVSCSALTGDGIDQIFEAVIRLYQSFYIKQNKLKKTKNCRIL